MATFGEVKQRSDAIKDSDDIQVELDYRDYLINAAEETMNSDDGAYRILQPWNMWDRPRRARLYERSDYVEQYLEQEARLVPIMEERLDHLHEGRSRQPQNAVIAEIKGLESLLAVRRDSDSNNERLMHDFLRYANDIMTADFVYGTQVTRDPNGSALTENDSPFMMGFIKSFPRLRKAFRELRKLEILHFPERFEVNRQRRSIPQYTSSGRLIPVRQPLIPQVNANSTPLHYDGSDTNELGYPLERIDSHQAAQHRLQRSFKARPPRVLALSQSKGEPRFPVLGHKPEIRGEATSPINRPIAECFRVPKAKRESPLRLASLSRSPALYIPLNAPSQRPRTKSEYFNKRGYAGPDGEYKEVSIQDDRC